MFQLSFRWYHPATGPELPSLAAVEQVPSLDQGQGTHHHEDCPSPHPDTSVDTAYTAGAPRPTPRSRPARPSAPHIGWWPQRGGEVKTTPRLLPATGLATVATQGWLHC